MKQYLLAPRYYFYFPFCPFFSVHFIKRVGLFYIMEVFSDYVLSQRKIQILGITSGFWRNFILKKVNVKRYSHYFIHMIAPTLRKKSLLPWCRFASGNAPFGLLFGLQYNQIQIIGSETSIIRSRIVSRLLNSCQISTVMCHLSSVIRHIGSGIR